MTEFVKAYPRTWPTIDITALVRVNRSRASNHAPGSGNISTNHSCKTGGSLYSVSYVIPLEEVGSSSNFDRIIVVKTGSLSLCEQASFK